MDILVLWLVGWLVGWLVVLVFFWTTNVQTCQLGRCKPPSFGGFLIRFLTGGVVIPLIFPKIPQSSLGILRVPQLPPPLEHPSLRILEVSLGTALSVFFSKIKLNRFKLEKNRSNWRKITKTCSLKTWLEMRYTFHHFRRKLSHKKKPPAFHYYNYVV